MASLFTKAFEDDEMVAFDISMHELKAIQRVVEHKASTRSIQLHCKLSPFLGGALIITRIAYQAIGMIDQLPPPLDEDVNIQLHHKLYRHKVKPNKAGKRKRESRESTMGSYAKKMRG